MSGIEEHRSIPKEVTTSDDLDFHFLRKEGILYLQSICGALWTDYNSHDPGVTLLEMLSYALTDLGLRLDTPTIDLLDSAEAGKGLSDQFFQAFEIFPTKAVTALDYRKLFIDLDGVKNCWLEPYQKTVYVNCREEEDDDQGNLSYDPTTFLAPSEYIKSFDLKGLYSVIVEKNPNTELTNAAIADSIREVYHANRNLCEDLINIRPVEEHKVSVCAAIEIAPESDEELVKAQILYAIDQYFSPSLKFYSLQELLDKGQTIDQIFEGPLLKNGFIDTQELKETELLKEVRLSDLIQVIMEIEGVIVIRDISIGNCEGSELENDWVICIDPGKKPARCDKSAFSFYKGVLPVNVNETRVSEYLEALRVAAQAERTFTERELSLPLPSGRKQSMADYTTIQNDFPDTYGIGREGIPGKVDASRRAKAKQLKAYLLFFDQILASYFKHLDKVKDLLSISGNETKTFFTQHVADIEGFTDLVAASYPTSEEALETLLFENFDDHLVRRNQILDHLLARFAERFGEYVFVMKTLYGSATEAQILRHKEQFLSEYPALSANRGCGFNYNQPPGMLWDTSNVSGLQHRVARLLGLKNYFRRDLHDSYLQITEDPGAPGNFLWEIRDGLDPGANTILTGIQNYPNHSLAANAAFAANIQLIQTLEDEIEMAFESPVVHGSKVGNLQILKTGGQFSFKVLNDALPPDSLADHPGLYLTQEVLKAEILRIMNFSKNEFTEEGMFLVEHMLLRPDVTTSPGEHFIRVCTDDCTSCTSLDPYSYKVSIVLPGYTYRFSNLDFRKYAESVIKAELPAHIIPKICWVGHRKGEVPDAENDLLEFEIAWKSYLMARNPSSQEQPAGELQNLLEAMAHLNTIYPVGRLLDCADEGDDTTGKIILGRSALGTLNTTEDDD